MKPVACVTPCWMLWVAGTSVTSSEASLPRIASFCWISGSMIIVVLIAPPPGRNKCAAIIAWVGKAFSNPAARKAIRAQAKWGRQDNAQVSSPNAPRRSGTRGRPRPRLCQASQQLGELARPREHGPVAGGQLDDLPAWRGELAAQRRIGGDHPLLNSPRAYSRIRPLANA